MIITQNYRFGLIWSQHWNLLRYLWNLALTTNRACLLWIVKSFEKGNYVQVEIKNYNKYRTGDNWVNYEKQRNFCVNLLRKNKTEYFQKLNVNDLSDNRKFWKTIKPFFRKKGLNSNKLMLKENNPLQRKKS